MKQLSEKLNGIQKEETMNCHQILLYEQTEKPTLYVPCPTEHLTIAHPTETDYIETIINK